MGISALNDSAVAVRPSGRATRRVALGVLGCLLASAGAASAAEPVPPSASSAAPALAPDEALLRARRHLLELAKERFEAGRSTGLEARQQLEGALDALRLAYQLTPASWLLFNLAQVKSRLGACHEATELYRRFLASNPAAEARANAEQALKLLGQCTEPSPSTTDDGLEPGLVPATSLTLVKEVEGRMAPAMLLAAGAESEVVQGGVGPWPWVFGGLALGSAIAAAFFYGEAVDAKHDLDRLQVGGPLVAQTQERGKTAQSAARVLGGFSVGFALGAGASLWPLLERGETRPASSQLGQLGLKGAGASYSFEF